MKKWAVLATQTAVNHLQFVLLFFKKKKKKSQNGASLHRRVMVLNKRQRGTEELAVRYFCRWKECTSL